MEGLTSYTKIEDVRYISSTSQCDEKYITSACMEGGCQCTYYV